MRFSVVTPACGCAKYLGETFGSLEAQSFRDFEVLLGVEESGDGSLEACREFAGRGGVAAEVGALPRTGAGGASRNWAFRRARGEYLVMLDGDDWLEADALERVDGALRQAGGADAVMLRARVRGEDGGEGGGEVGNQLGLGAEEVLSGMEVLRRIAGTGAHCKNYGALVAVRREFLEERGLWQLEGVQSEDSEWMPRVLLAAERVIGVREATYNYRRREGSVSSEGTAKILGDVAGIVKRLGGIYAGMEMPGEARRLLENDAVSILCWYLFNRLYAGRFTDGERAAAIEAAGEEWRGMWRSASRAKRAGLRLLAAGCGKAGIWLAKAYFGRLYYPLTGVVKGGK